MPGAWDRLADMPAALSQSHAAAWNGRLYLLGGFGTTSSDAKASVYSAQLGDHQLADWREERAMPLAVRLGRGAALQGRLYALGGLDASNTARGEVASAAIEADGRLGIWRPESALPDAIASFGAAASDVGIYVAGGYTGGSAVPQTRYTPVSRRGGIVLATATAAGLAEGQHVIRASASDLAGNVSAASAAFHVDLTAPKTSLELLGDFRQIGATTYALPGLALRLSATDYPALAGGVAAGVAASYLSTGAAAYALPGFQTLDPGFYALGFASVDGVGNFESTHTAAVKVDAAAPGAVTTLAAFPVSETVLRLAWTAPGDDGPAGDLADAAVRLDVKTSAAALSFLGAQVVFSSGPLAAGQRLAASVGGLTQNTEYFAAVFTRDAAGNWSGASNTASTATFRLAASADGVARLASPAPEATVTAVPLAQAATAAYAVAASSQALTPAAGGFYELTSGLTFAPEAPAVLSFSFDPTLVSTADAAIYVYDPLSGAWSSQSIVNQQITLIDATHAVLSGGIFHTSLYAPMVRDTLPPLTAFAPTGAPRVLEGRLFVAGPSSGSLAAQDLAPAGATPSGVAATFYALDAGAEQAYAGPFALPEGRRAVAFRSVDRRGNREAATTAEVYVDASAPALAAALDQPTLPIPGGFAALSATAVLTLSALDPEVAGARAGLSGASYVLDGATLTLAVTPGDPTAVAAVPLGLGLHRLAWRAGDRVGHAAQMSLRIVVGDARAPDLAFAFPRPDEAGLCRLAQGRVEVRGTAFDENMAGWSLAQGSVLLGSGTANADGLLGVRDATGKAGSFALSLTAADLVENAAALNLGVQAGQPARTLALGGKRVLNKPRGVATGPNRIYVSDTNADAVRVFDAAGTPLAVLGDKKGPAKLDKPAGLVLDGSGNILAADAGNKRVVKLSPAGVFLAEFGKGLLKRPMAVALSLGRIVVADAEAGRLVVFSEAGALIARAELPGAPDSGRHDGVAVSPSGACLAVADAKTSRIRTFDAEQAAGLAAFGTKGEIKENRPLPAEFFLNKPSHLAFDAAGTLLVADRNNGLVQGFGLPGTPVVVAMGTPGRSGGGTRLSSTDGESGAVAATARVGRLEGGRVENPDGAVVEIPAGAISEDLDVGVAKAADAGDEYRLREAARNLVGLAAASPAREFSPHGLTFAEPAVITLPYDALLAVAPRELKIHYWNADRGVWEGLSSAVDEAARTVSARVSHFSVYQVLGQAGAVNTLADPEAGFAFRAIYAFPNPAVGGQKPTVHVAVGRADKVTIRFYDVAGTPVHEATLDTPAVVNDESGPHLAYEYAWDGHIPSGVYLYTVTAEKAGYAPIKRVGKLAIVR